MSIEQAIILSIVEGISEFLPISSTGHLVLTAQILKIPQSEFVKSFEIYIQLGAILSVVAIYFRTLSKNLSIYPKLLAAFLPTALVGFTLYKLVKSYLLGNELITVGALILGGIALIGFERILGPQLTKGKELEELSLKQACLIGVCQSFSIIPGVSRAAATIIGGLTVGLTRRSATEFSFLLAIPTMIAATGLDLIKSEFRFTPDQINLLIVGLIGSFITAYLSVKFLIKFVEKHSFIPFGIYRIVAGIIFWIIFIR